MIPNLITASGRETMSLIDRIDLLRADLMAPPFLGIEPNVGRTPNQNVHDLKLTIGWIRNVIALYEQAIARGQTNESLERGSNRMVSPIECLVLAWRRGGHSEYQRVHRLQKELASAD